MNKVEVTFAKAYINCKCDKNDDEYKTIVSALEKQIPKKPIKYIVPAERIKIRNTYWGKDTTIYKCPHCNNYISITNIHCHECGQALDWSDTK